MRASVYYNEIDSYCAQWLQNLMDAGLIPRGDIDTRSIEDVTPDELRGYTQCHFFAGLGGWPYAMQLAGWGTRPVWTGSCPCQPFSAAGKGAGFADERHLWPSWQHLISQCNPPVVFGEQVASATQWLGLVCGDLENMAYAVGFNHIEAASAGADHRRDRIFFVADTCEQGLAKRECECGVLSALGSQSKGQDAAHDGRTMVNANRFIGGQRREIDSRGYQGSSAQERTGLGSTNGSGLVANTNELGPSEGWKQRSRQFGGTSGDPQSCFGWIIGHDGKARRVPESSIRLLADGIPARVGKLRALGNAIDPRPAAAFIAAYMQARGLIVGEMDEAA